MNFVKASDSSLLIELGDSISAETSARVLTLFHKLEARKDVRIRNLHPGYTSLLVDIDPLAATHDEVAAMAQAAAEAGPESAATASPVVEIPVCYGGEFGPDLADVATYTGLPADEVVRRHVAGECLVAFLGFTAGFAYMSGMAQELSTPRLATPRRAVAAGSVGIAGGQTGIYPAVTPGGWRLIGRTPLRMFDPNRAQASLLNPGDRVKFCAISREEFEGMTQPR